MGKKVICRPCKEKPGTWEIVKPNGEVDSKHYTDKSQCITAGEKMAAELAVEMSITDKVQTKD